MRQAFYKIAATFVAFYEEGALPVVYREGNAPSEMDATFYFKSERDATQCFATLVKLGVDPTSFLLSPQLVGSIHAEPPAQVFSPHRLLPVTEALYTADASEGHSPDYRSARSTQPTNYMSYEATMSAQMLERPGVLQTAGIGLEECHIIPRGIADNDDKNNYLYLSRQLHEAFDGINNSHDTLCPKFVLYPYKTQPTSATAVHVVMSFYRPDASAYYLASAAVIQDLYDAFGSAVLQLSPPNRDAFVGNLVRISHFSLEVSPS